MIDLSIDYMGLKLKNPIIVGSSGLTNSVEKVKELERFGAGAVVLKSLFEEQILAESAHSISKDESYGYDVHDYISNYVRNNTLGEYLQFIRKCKAEVKIPIIASINCISGKEWTDFAKKIEDAGAHALEINISLLPSDHEIESAVNEEMYFFIIDKIRNTVKIPVSLKMSPYSSGLAHLIKKISWTKNVDSIVLFNRYYNPDIDIDKMEIISSGVFSKAEDLSTSLRWIALSSKVVDIDLVATTGIHSGAAVIKQILAGAKAVEIASVLYKNGPDYLQAILHEIEIWMEKQKYSSPNEFRGKMAFDPKSNKLGYERIQFMKYFGGIE